MLVSMSSSVILSWNKYIEYLKETFAKNMEPLGFEEWNNGRM